MQAKSTSDSGEAETPETAASPADIAKACELAVEVERLDTASRALSSSSQEVR